MCWVSSMARFGFVLRPPCQAVPATRYTSTVKEHSDCFDRKLSTKSQEEGSADKKSMIYIHLLGFFFYPGTHGTWSMDKKIYCPFLCVWSSRSRAIAVHQSSTIQFPQLVLALWWLLEVRQRGKWTPRSRYQSDVWTIAMEAGSKVQIYRERSREESTNYEKRIPHQRWLTVTESLLAT